MRYVEALRYVYGLQPRGMQLGLERMQAAAARCGDPQRHYGVVHVAGTNGKGSVAAMLAAVLQAAGYRTGLYTSPHLHRFVERIRVQGKPIREAQVAAGVAQLRRQLGVEAEASLTFFELTTLLALQAFGEAQCDIAVVEVGLGGRLDATNIVLPEVSVITSVGLDHTRQLGRTLAAIASEKAGIVKRQVPLVVGARQASARAVIAAQAASAAAEAWWLGQDFAPFTASDPPAAGATVGVRVGTQRWLLTPPLAGQHQADNLATTLATLVCLRQRGWQISDAALQRGLARTQWPGRLETIAGTPPLLLDAAHNPAGCASLARHLRSLPRPGRRVLLFGAMADKQHAAMLRSLRAEVDLCVFTRAGLTRAANPQSFLRHAPGEVFTDPRRALRRAERLAGRDGLVVVAGSILVMAAVRAARLGLHCDPAIAF